MFIQWIHTESQSGWCFIVITYHFFTPTPPYISEEALPPLTSRDCKSRCVYCTHTNFLQQTMMRSVTFLKDFCASLLPTQVSCVRNKVRWLRELTILRLNRTRAERRVCWPLRGTVGRWSWRRQQAVSDSANVCLMNLSWPDPRHPRSPPIGCPSSKLSVNSWLRHMLSAHTGP